MRPFDMSPKKIWDTAVQPTSECMGVRRNGKKQRDQIRSDKRRWTCSAECFCPSQPARHSPPNTQHARCVHSRPSKYSSRCRPFWPAVWERSWWSIRTCSPSWRRQRDTLPHRPRVDRCACQHRVPRCSWPATARHRSPAAAAVPAPAGHSRERRQPCR